MLKDRIQEMRKKKGMTQQELAEKAGVTQGTIFHLESGRNKSSRNIVKIANALSVSTSWLLYGDKVDKKNGNAIPSEFVLSPWDDETILYDDEIAVPYLKEVCLSAGHGSEALEDYEGRKLRFSRRLLQQKNINPENVVCLTVHGESMEPVFIDGATVGVNLEDKYIKDGFVYAINNEGLLQIKILRRPSVDKIHIESYNPSYPCEVKDLSRIEILGRIFWYSVIF